ncbi:ARM REPEAT PROTEIN INTERACTING WITH ABF2-like [Zingiber officinale]|uniref:ARM REPEAT PROTEIN INTERACTING WITH ABF2-like n=1 Tax=Zingiber officinale TaxID=94328 RepID=UPI001C4ABFFB|nr:ARM REPEAT PROTEIN INTERACTING WITH ABF2-like [Zingiber officinale]
MVLAVVIVSFAVGKIRPFFSPDLLLKLADWQCLCVRWRWNGSGGAGRSGGSWRRRAAPPPQPAPTRLRPLRWRKRRWESKKCAAIAPRKRSPARSGPKSMSWSELSPGASLFEPPQGSRPSRTRQERCTEEAVSVIVEGGAVPALVKHLQEPPPLLVRDGSASGEDRPLEHEVENGSAFALGLLAMKPEHQQLINDAGALPLLVNLLKRHKKGYNYWAVNGVIRRAADAITNLARGNSNIKTYVRLLHTKLAVILDVYPIEFSAYICLSSLSGLKVGFLPLCNCWNLLTWRCRGLLQIVECKALPTLILMLQSVDPSVHYEAEATVCAKCYVVHKRGVGEKHGKLDALWRKVEEQAHIQLV